MTMEINENKGIELKSMSVRYSIRFSFVLFPFDIPEFIGQLVQAGYFPTVPPIPKIPGQVRFNYNGKIAQKGDVEVEINGDRGVIAITSGVPSLSIQSFDEILQIVRNKLEVDLSTQADFYEVMVSTDVKTNKNALQAIAKFNEKNGSIKELGKILGQDVSGFSLRLIPKDGVLSSLEWLDLTIEPNVIKPSTHYRVMGIFRSKEKSNVDSFIKSFDERLSRMLEIIEA